MPCLSQFIPVPFPSGRKGCRPHPSRTKGGGTQRPGPAGDMQDISKPQTTERAKNNTDAGGGTLPGDQDREWRPGQVRKRLRRREQSLPYCGLL